VLEKRCFRIVSTTKKTATTCEKKVKGDLREKKSFFCECVSIVWIVENN
jgi:hypothetical protein